MFPSLILLISFTPFVQKKTTEKKEPPKILYTVPLIVRPGEKQKLVLRGNKLDAVKEVKVVGADGAKVGVLSGKKTPLGNNQPKRIGDTELQIELDLPKGTKPGATLTAIGPGGESNAYLLLVPDDTAAVKEKEPNDGFAAAQKILLPSAVEGSINNDKDVDVYQFEGKKGDTVKVVVQAARFGSPLDALATLHDADRKIIAQADDTDGSADPILTATLPRDGVYFVTLIDAHDLGGPQFGYRLVVRK
jgi:hypothetical protein